MGETGCGKTRLIKYMCYLLSMNSGKEILVIMKVRAYNKKVVNQISVNSHY